MNGVRSHVLPLTVFVTGEGEVSSSPSGIECGVTCSAEQECTGEFEGEVTLTVAKAETGYVFAGWIGCKHTAATTCEVDVTAATEVTAVFLKEGKEGPPGPQGGEGPKGAEGPKGPKGSEGPKGSNGENGKEGSPGKVGEKGANGAAGPADAQGPAGPAGQVELVTCKKGKKKHCTTKTVSGTVKFTASSAHATLSRHGLVYAVGMVVRRSGGRLSLRLTSLHKLRPGHYTLTLISDNGHHETIRSESFTLG